MLSEGVRAAVPAAADTWTAVGTFTVPANMKRLVQIKVGIAPDMGATGTVRIAPILKISGSGLGEQDPHELIAPFGDVVLGTSGAVTLQMNEQSYDVDIPVNPGATYDCLVNTLDEAVTAGTIRCMVVYDTTERTGKNSQSQYVDAAATTTADVWTTVGTITIPKLDDAHSPTKIIEVICAVAPDQAALALLRCSAWFRLSGAGLQESGKHEFTGPANGTLCTTPGALGYDNCVIRHKVDIPINAGGQILVEHMLDTETPTAGTVAVGLRYA
jgi:hypothetical protein